MPDNDDHPEEIDSRLISALAAKFHAKPTACPGLSSKYVSMESTRRFILVPIGTAPDTINEAMALGLGCRNDLQLTLVLPRGSEFSTMQRLPWLRRPARPHVFTYSGAAISDKRQVMPTKKETIARLGSRLRANQTFMQDLRDSTAPPHFGKRSMGVNALMDWAFSHPKLDPAHRRSGRIWQCMGIRVLSIHGSAQGLEIKAGIHYRSADQAPLSVGLPRGKSLSPRQLAQICAEVQCGIDSRLDPAGEKHGADEHWLQAVIRRDPKLIGVEQPALREVPAWRPQPHFELEKKWSRGYIDLMGVDGSGDIRIAETKVAANKDPMMVFQGLDYYIWAQAYGDVLRERLGAPKRSEFVVHYVVGSTPLGQLHVSPHAQVQIDHLDIPYRFQTVTGWFPDRDGNINPRGKLHPIGHSLDTWST